VRRDADRSTTPTQVSAEARGVATDPVEVELQPLRPFRLDPEAPLDLAARSRPLGPSLLALRERVFDLAAVIVLLPLLLPLGLLVALVVFLDSPGSVFYRSQRIGRGGRPFAMLKFRTMRTGATGPSLTRGRDERFTPIGSFLATFRLDELPQIWHVITGQMRLVGPRPELPEFVEMHRRQYERILSVPPGITGRTQLIHFADGEHLDTDDPLAHYAEKILPSKLQHDISYVQERSLVGDLIIIVETVLLPFRVAATRATQAVLGHRPQAARYAAALAAAFCVLLAYVGAGGAPR
jgi:lipopolysaccharide/colanic/teichoic acid biosynthesis glycosyltransferase